MSIQDPPTPHGKQAQSGDAALSYEGHDLEAMSAASAYARYIVDCLRPYLAGTVAEVGAGRGNLTRLLAETAAVRIVAIEPARTMYEQLSDWATDLTRVECRLGCLEDHAPDLAGDVDSVVYVNVLEHIERDGEELRIAFDVLKPGGHLCVFVPALPCLYSDFDRRIGHWRRYTKAGLRRTAELAGFKTLRLRYFDLPGVLPWYLFMVLLGGDLNPWKAGLYDRVAVPALRWFDRLVPSPFGKNLLYVGRKDAAGPATNATKGTPP